MKTKALIAALSIALVGCGDKEVGDISLGLLTTKDIKIEVLNDPVITGVTCHFSNIVADLDFSDPSDMGISCRRTGPITADMIAKIDHSKNGEVVFKKSKSIFFKTLKIRRVYDPISQSLMYVSYSTKEIEGSYKHSLSTVPLWGTQAYQEKPADGETQ